MAAPRDRDDAAGPGVALVTGAGRRLGRAIALGLAEAGYAVAVHYNRSADGAERTAKEITGLGQRAITTHRDLSEPETCGALIDEVRAALGPVSVLVNSAARFDKDNLRDLSVESWRRLTDTNLAAPVFLMQAFARQDPLPPHPAIINLLDTQMTSASPERLSYFCSKFGLEGATRLAAMDLAVRGITVNAIAPGLVLPSGQTEQEFLRRQQQTPLGEGLDALAVAEAVLYLIGARHVTGHTLVVDSGQHLMGFGNARLETKP